MMSRPDEERTAETVWSELRNDRLCDRFEFLLKAGQPILVADFLRSEGIDPAAASPELLHELHRLDAAYRPGEQTRPDADHRVQAGEGEVATGLVLDGRYRLERRIGVGGMGEVWEAEQTEPVRRRVAVKLIKWGMDSRAVLARFAAERQALAVMEHTSIARVFDAGSTPSGRPYFVMELVDGVPITQFCDERRLTPEQRLELFVPVCQAIQHAHMKGVIHRDIKPSNVLVTVVDGRPVPKVIDFGVAKATAPTLTDATFSTGVGSVVGTLPYMSPEQAGLNNQDIDTRSDVYSLGVLLYELLTGNTPLDARRLRRAAIDEALRMVREVDAPRPSDKLSTADTLPSLAACRGTEPKKLTGLLRGELDWVVLKALEKDRGRRYESPLAFAADVQRHLANEVVTARPPTPGYKLRKFVRRNKGPVTAGLAVFVALLGGVIGTTLGLFEAKRGRDDAVEAQTKEAIQRGKAEENENTAKANADLAFERLYKSEVRLLGPLWEDRQYDPARESLARLTPEHTGGRDLRRFEWHFWNSRLANPVRTLATTLSPTDIISAIRVSRDGSQYCLMCYTHGTPVKATLTYLVNDTRTDATLRSWTLDRNKVGYGAGMDISPDFSRIVLVEPTGRLSVRNTETKAEVFGVEGKYGLRPKFDPSGRRLLGCGADGTTTVWDAETGTELARCPNPAQATAAEFSADGTRVVFSTGLVPNDEPTKSVHVWDTSTGKVELSRTTFYNCTHLAYRPDGLQVAGFCRSGVISKSIGTTANEVLMWDLKTDQPVVRPIPGFHPYTFAYSPDSTKLVAAGHMVATTQTFTPQVTTVQSSTMSQHQLRVWDTATGAEQIFPVFPRNTLLQLSSWTAAFAPDGRHLFLNSEANRVDVWDVQQMQSDRVLPGNLITAAPGHLALSADGRRLAVGGGNGFTVCDVERHRTRRAGGERSVSAVVFDPGGERMFSAGATADRKRVEITLWNVSDWKRQDEWDVEVPQPPGTSGWVADRISLDVSADGTRLAAALPDLTLRVWDVRTQKELAKFDAPLAKNTGIGRVKISPDGNTVTGRNGSLCVWDLRNRERELRLPDGGDAEFNPFMPSGIRTFAYLDDRRLLVPTMKRLKVFDVQTGQELLTVPGFFGQVYDLLVLPGVDRVIGVCNGQSSIEPPASLRVWETTGWGELMRLTLADNLSTAVVASGDGRRLAITGRGSIQLVDTTDPLNPHPRPDGGMPSDGDPVPPTTYAHWAEHYLGKNQKEDAVTAYRKAVGIEPSNATLRLRLASLLQQSDADAAVTHYREGLRLDPKEYRGWYELGLLLQGRGDHPAAVDALRTGLKADPRPPEQKDGPGGSTPTRPAVLAALGDSLNRLGQSNEATAAYHQAMKGLDVEKQFLPDMGRPPKPASVLVELTSGLLRQNKVKEADAECEEFVRRASVFIANRAKTDTPAKLMSRYATEQLAQTMTQIADRYLGANRWEDAVRWADRAIGTSAEFRKTTGQKEEFAQLDQAFQLKAISLNWLDRGKEAVTAIDEAIRLTAPANRPYQRLMRARYVAKTGDHQEAAKLVKAELAGGNTNTWDAALAYALCVKAAKDDEKLKEEYAKEAVALLRLTLAAKKFNAPWKTDADLNPIRERADFKAVMAEFELLSAGKRQAVPSPPVTDFREAHALDTAGLKAWLDQLPPGYRPTVVAARTGGATARFDAVAVHDGATVPFALSAELGGATASHAGDFDRMRAAGWQMSGVTTYREGDKQLRHHLWVKDGRNWAGYGLRPADLPAKVAEWRKGGLRPLNFHDAQVVPTDPLFGIVLGPDEGREWEIATGLSAAALADRAVAARTAGWRLDALHGVGVGTDRLYTVSVVANPLKEAWELKVDLTPEEYEKAVSDGRKRGLRPLSVTSADDGKRVRYTAVFVAFAPPPREVLPAPKPDK
jgi:serine/threonine protein kinase/WD40 repeat protein/tetratricopeptide (TPR) repeat protein